MKWTIFAFVALVIFAVFTTVYAATADARRVRVLPKWVWVLLCALVPAVGGLLYLTVGRPIREKPKPGDRRPRRVVAPDDDPEFLADLAERLEREKKPDDDQGEKK